MKLPLRILHLEDDPSDAKLIHSALQANGIVCAINCLEKQDDFVAALERGGIDLIISDYALPAFDGLSALEIAHARWPAIPLIFVSGTLGEERAVESLKSGATDYVLKENLARLVPAVRRAIDEVEKRDERQRLEVQFVEAQKMEAIGHLAAGVAHDFNNILAVIQGYSDLFKNAGTLSPEHLGFAEQIGAASQRAATLTRQLLLFSRKEVSQLRDLDLNQSVNDMTKMLRRTIGEEIELQFKFSMQPLFIHADAGMMDQVLMNLAVNARDAMPQGGRLVIETSRMEFDESILGQSANGQSGSFMCLSVSDTGCGIPPEILPNIFTPFFTTKDVGKGTGLGLATVFGIVKQHNGWISVYSEVGHGSTFRIYLPRLATMSEQKEEHLVSASPRGDETLLLVEDDIFLRASVRKTLSQLGYRVLEAASGVEALEIWKLYHAEIHLLFTDMVMPGGITGKDLGTQLLKEKPELKVMYVSGYSAEVAGKDFPLKEGVNFLTKPFQAQKLAQTIRNRLDD